MCNLYHLAPREQVERHFRHLHLQLPPDYPEVPVAGRPHAVGPYGQGLIVRRLGADREALMAQWGMIAPGSRTRRPASRAILTNNARAETVAERPTYRAAWRQGQRCLIPCAAYLEPNWETGRNLWWLMRRADGAPWALAGLWSSWVDPGSGEIVPNFTMLTINCDGHPLLSRLHKPDPTLPADAQDKRAVVALEPEAWSRWLEGSEQDARALLTLPPADRFDLHDAQRTDALLRQPSPQAQAQSHPRQQGLFDAG
ncbi:MAG: hypothetical protein AMXMBFR78_12910 [Rubrivivax sp.]|jgi:putative SOS response-associated peptidase YedK|nr:SOS response-associated peptidase family protein [Rubrivivax sp.]